MKITCIIFLLSTFVVYGLLSYANANCDTPLLGSAKITATSSLSSDRGPSNARLDGRIAWTAGNSDFGQYFVIDLGETKNVSAIATQGRPYTSEFVQEYRIEYGSNGIDFSEYKDSEGNTKLFKGNRDGNSIQRNYFDNPIVAQWIRINPTRWRDRISMRVELYGCNYIEEVMSFDGQGFVRKDVTYDPIMSHRDNIRLRFKTHIADGILIYSKGTQGDYFALQLVNNKLVLNIDLGSKQATSITVGSLLDDNLWHDVIIYRHNRDVVFTVDRVIVKQKIKGDFTQLDLNREIFIGGVPNFNVDGLIVTYNFTGCIENLFINYTNLISELKYKQDFTYTKVKTAFYCPDRNVYSMTFKKPDSHVVLKANEGLGSLNVSIDFRTFNEEGMLIYHKFSIVGALTLYLHEGKIKLDISVGEKERITIDEYQEKFNDGTWHKVILMAAQDYIELNVDKKPVKIRRQLKIKTGNQFLLGGGVWSFRGLVGCMRYISVDGTGTQPISSSGDVVKDSCQMVDRCNPNPCEHGGICEQNSEEFICKCGNSGYDGAVCHTSSKPLSCEAVYRNNQYARGERIMIDIDGSGSMDPFPVICDISADSKTVKTTLGHRSDRTTTVNGFDRPGSFIQDIIYDADTDQITELVNRSRSCKQSLVYECRRSRLLNTPVGSRGFEPFSWWVSRDNQKMDYWAGSIPGTHKCACALSGTCIDKSRWCNCDAFRDEWLSDGGDITEKGFLPVRQLRFGDTGTPLDNKEGRYTLGHLICEGDNIYDNVVTFRQLDATINYPTFDMGHSGDIYFEFRTSAETGVFVHSIGPTDYIKVALVGGDQIQFNYYAGNGPMSLTVKSVKLNDNRWHSVLVERNRKEAQVVVDGSLNTKIKEPIGISRAIYLTSDLVVGATLELRDGYVGCMRALMLNGRPYDMFHFASRGLYGVSPGCIGKCESGPCLNNGTCLEGYSHYTCDCRWTAFKGPICADEIGVHLRKGDMIEYDFEGTYKSTTEEKLRIGFTTTEPGGLLMGLIGYSGEYLSVVMANDGHLKIVLDFGFERQEVISNYSLANGQMHDVRISRKNGGRVLVIQADNYEPELYTFKIDKTQDVQFDNIKNLYLGRNRTMPAGEGFIGCVSRVEFDDVYVLKLFFQEERPANIRSSPEELREDFCGVEAVTYPPEPAETRTSPSYDPSILGINKGYTRADSAVLGGILAIIFLALIAMAILIGRYVSRHKGEYKTHEDKGARDAPDADTAIVQGQTGHNVSKKKEIFI